MRRGFDWRYLLGGALLAAVAAVILAVFALLGHANSRELYLADGDGVSFGWRYELLEDGGTRAYEPEFDEDLAIPELPEGIDAVRITRTMTEEVEDAELEWHAYWDGVKVFLDGELLHSDFRWAVERGKDGFLRLTDADWSRLHRAQGEVWQRVRLSLPADYLGRELSVVTYFPEDWGIPSPEYPYLGNDKSYVASFLLPAVAPDAVMTAYALFTLLIVGMFLMDLPNEGADKRAALLCLYFLLLFLRQAAASYAGYYSGLSDQIETNLLYELYVAPLYLYLALRLKRGWRGAICAMIAAWVLYEVARELVNVYRGNVGYADTVGPWALAVFAAVTAATCARGIAWAKHSRGNRRQLGLYALAGAGIAFVYLLNKFHMWRGAQNYLVNGIWESLRVGNFEPVVSLATDIVSIVTLIAVVSEALRRTLRTRQEVSVLQDRAQMTMESYERLLAAQGATSALHHEMRHHMTALCGILKSGDLERAERYAESVAGELERLPAGRYSQNPLVDVIAGSFLTRASAQGVRVEHRLSVPRELDIADEDLSVFVSNMLQNALEACERMDAGADRYIRAEMRLRGKFLFIRCVNSAPDEGEARPERPGHGYGLAAMRKIADKYNSALVLEHSAGEFSVMSDLCLSGR